MNLPDSIAALIAAQDNYDAAAYAACFTETAVVIDEGNTYNGRSEIAQWIAKANEDYKTVMTPLKYTESGTFGVLTAEISGTFAGSPIILKYYFEQAAGLIQSLKITG